MKKLIVPSTLLILSICFCNAIFSQPFKEKNIELQLCKEWKLQSYEENGKQMELNKIQQDSRVVFKKDHSSESRSNNNRETGKWVFNKKDSTVSIINDSTLLTLKLKIYRIEKTKMVVGLKTSEKAVIKMTMLAVE